MSLLEFEGRDIISIKDFTLEEIKRWGREKPVREIVKAPALFPRIEGEKKEEKSGVTTYT